MRANPLIVAVGVLIEAQRVLVSQRPPGVHLAERWEFPGGKVESAESTEAALRREFHEELDIELLAFEKLMEVSHHYPEKSVLLRVFRIHQYRGTPRGKEGQRVAWQGAAALEGLAFPEANLPILDYVRRELSPR